MIYIFSKDKGPIDNALYVLIWIDYSHLTPEIPQKETAQNHDSFILIHTFFLRIPPSYNKGTYSQYSPRPNSHTAQRPCNYYTRSP